MFERIFLGTYARNAGNIENKFAALDREKESNKFEIFKHVLGEILYEKNPQELIAGM